MIVQALKVEQVEWKLWFQVGMEEVEVLVLCCVQKEEVLEVEEEQHESLQWEVEGASC